jgi:lysophospholipase L1-like esterase
MVLCLLAGLILAAAALTACGGSGEGDEPPPGEREGERRTPQRAEDSPLAGAERLLIIGDSLAAAGGSPTYPELLAGAGVATETLALPGTTTSDWLPGGELFDARLASLLPEADAVLISLGGNDLERALGGGDGPDALGRAAGPGAPAAVVEAMDTIERNLRRTIRAIRRSSPETPVAFVGYPDYSASAAWQQRVGSLELMGLRAGLRELQTRAGLAGADLVVDMLAATGRGETDRLLSGGEYLSAAGHRLYARRLARLLRSRGE